MRENLFAQLDQKLGPAERQPFDAYRRSRPARKTAQRKAIYLSRIGPLTAAQERVVAVTAEYLGVFFELPVHRGADLDPAAFPRDARREHPSRGQPQLLTDYLLQEALRLDRPEDALICMGATAWDLWSSDHCGGPWGSVFGEALYGHAGLWSLRYLGDPGTGELSRRCLKRSCAVASHEALHVLGLDHCDDVPCVMRGAACLSGPLHLCPACLRKLCWNRQFDLLPHLHRICDFLGQWTLVEERERWGRILELLASRGP